MGKDNLIKSLTRKIKATTKNFHYKSLLSKDDKGSENENANSGHQSIIDLCRQNIYINGKKVELSHEKKEFKITVDGKEKIVPRSGRNDYFFAKEIWENMFETVGISIPNHEIIGELIVHCNQAGYEAPIYELLLKSCENKSCDNVLTPTSPKVKIVSIHANNNNTNSIQIEIKQKIQIHSEDGLSTGEQQESIFTGNSVKFTIESKGGNIEYKNGEISTKIHGKLNGKLNEKLNGKEKLHGKPTKNDINKIIKALINLFHKLHYKILGFNTLEITENNHLVQIKSSLGKSFLKIAETVKEGASIEAIRRLDESCQSLIPEYGNEDKNEANSISNVSKDQNCKDQNCKDTNSGEQCIVDFPNLKQSLVFQDSFQGSIRELGEAGAKIESAEGTGNDNVPSVNKVVAGTRSSLF